MYQWIICLLLVGCHEVEHSNTRRETFSGRYSEIALYHAEVPPHWERVETEGDRTDTKLPICSYKIGEDLLTLHNFPYSSIEQRISPEAQVERWKRQVPGEIYDVMPFSNSGFGGFRLETKGMIAYAMQLTPLIFRSITGPDQKADYTIKFMGDIEKNRQDVDAFAESFEWITPIEYGKL